MRTRWYFHLRGEVYAYGPVGPMTKEEVKDYIRKAWGNGKQIPSGTQIWEA